jgi:hypothetical protein
MSQNLYRNFQSNVRIFSQYQYFQPFNNIYGKDKLFVHGEKMKFNFMV